MIILLQLQPPKEGVVASMSAHVGVPPVQPCSGETTFPTTASEQLGRLRMEEGGPGWPALKESPPFSPSGPCGRMGQLHPQAMNCSPKGLETPLSWVRPWRTLRRQRIKMLKRASHKKKNSYCMIPFIGDIKDEDMDTDRRQVWGPREGGGGAAGTDGSRARVSLWGKENVPKSTVVKISQFCEGTKNHRIVYFKSMDCVLCKLYLQKADTNKPKKLPWL